MRLEIRKVFSRSDGPPSGHQAALSYNSSPSEGKSPYCTASPAREPAAPSATRGCKEEVGRLLAALSVVGSSSSSSLWDLPVGLGPLSSDFIQAFWQLWIFPCRPALRVTGCVHLLLLWTVLKLQLSASRICSLWAWGLCVRAVSLALHRRAHTCETGCQLHSNFRWTVSYFSV